MRKLALFSLGTVLLSGCLGQNSGNTAKVSAVAANQVNPSPTVAPGNGKPTVSPTPSPTPTPTPNPTPVPVPTAAVLTVPATFDGAANVQVLNSDGTVNSKTNPLLLKVGGTLTVKNMTAHAVSYRIHSSSAKAPFPHETKNNAPAGTDTFAVTGAFDNTNTNAPNTGVYDHNLGPNFPLWVKAQ